MTKWTKGQAATESEWERLLYLIRIKKIDVEEKCKTRCAIAITLQTIASNWIDAAEAAQKQVQIESEITSSCM